MPAISSDLKDLMCYQISKFERTVGPLTELDTNPCCNGDATNVSSKSESVSNHCYQNIPQLGCDDDLGCDCFDEGRVVSSSGKDKHLLHHHSFHYCPKYESRVKRSRTIRFGSGGDVTINKNHGYANTSWLVPSTPDRSMPPPLRGKIQPPSPRQNGDSQITPHGADRSSNLTINLNVPVAYDDLDSFLKTHSLSIRISVSERKSPVSGTKQRTTIDDFNRNQLMKSGWYYGSMSWQESTEVLKSAPLGTFLIRDSSDPRYSFSLSVQTTKGPISSRICYVNGKYCLDSQPVDMSKMPAFPSVLALIDHYTKNRLGQTSPRTGRQVWVDSKGEICSPVQLTKPKMNEAGSLRHLARLVLNANPSLLDSPQLPSPIKSYLEEYPYSF